VHYRHFISDGVIGEKDWIFFWDFLKRGIKLSPQSHVESGVVFASASNFTGPIVSSGITMNLKTKLALVLTVTFAVPVQAQIYTVTGPNGTTGTITVAVSTATTSTTQPAPPPTQAATPAASLPGMPGAGPYASDAWLATFGREASGNIDLTPLIPANAVYISTASTPGHLASDHSDFNSAQNAAIANGSLCILFRDGGTYSSSALNNNIQGVTGTSGHPLIVSRIGRGGFTDHSLPRPVLQGRLGIAGAPGNGHAWGGPIHYVILDGLDFNHSGSSATGPAVSFVDTNLGASSDHIGLFDISVEGYQQGIDLEADDPLSYTNNTFILDGCSVFNCTGGATQAGFYANCIYDLLVNRSYFIGNGYKNQLGTAHDVYINGNPKIAADSQLRFINTVFGTAAACGCEANRGGFFHNCVSLANPTGIYGGGGAPAAIESSIIDGGGGEFDGTSVKFASAQGYVLTAGSTLSLQPGNAGSGRGWGAYLDCATSGYIQNVFCVNKNDAGDVQNNGGFAIGVHCTDVGKNGEGMPTAATVATIGPNVIVHNWYDSSGANAINLSQTTPPLPTIAYSGLVVLPGVNNVLGVTGKEPQYVDPARCCSTYAKTLGIAGVTDGPTLLQAMAGQNSTNWKPALEAQAVVNYVAAGFVVMQ
jgi:hypothetical protein